VREVKESAKEQWEEYGCGYEQFNTIEKGYQSLKETLLEKQPKIWNQLNDLRKQNLIKYMITNSVNQGEGEACDRWTYLIYTTDGLLLWMRIDYTS
jgi:hypothetical protein